MPYGEAFAYQTTIENLILRIHGDMASAIYGHQHPGHDYPDHVGPGLTGKCGFSGVMTVAGALRCWRSLATMAALWERQC